MACAIIHSSYLCKFRQSSHLEVSLDSKYLGYFLTKLRSSRAVRADVSTALKFGKLAQQYLQTLSSEHTVARYKSRHSSLEDVSYLDYALSNNHSYERRTKKAPIFLNSIYKHLTSSNRRTVNTPWQRWHSCPSCIVLNCSPAKPWPCLHGRLFFSDFHAGSVSCSLRAPVN